MFINTAQKVTRIKPDLVIWNTKEKTCNIVEFSCPADINITKKEEEKSSAYGPLIQNLQIMHPSYHCNIIPIKVGALESVSESLNGYLCQLGFNSFKLKRTICKM